jgi:hypothetical protein
MITEKRKLFFCFLFFEHSGQNSLTAARQSTYSKHKPLQYAYRVPPQNRDCHGTLTEISSFEPLQDTLDLLDRHMQSSPLSQENPGGGHINSTNPDTH